MCSVIPSFSYLALAPFRTLPRSQSFSLSLPSFNFKKTFISVFFLFFFLYYFIFLLFSFFVRLCNFFKWLHSNIIYIYTLFYSLFMQIANSRIYILNKIKKMKKGNEKEKGKWKGNYKKL